MKRTLEILKALISRSLLLSLVCLHCIFVKAQQELNVVKGEWLEFTDAQNSLYHYLSDEACKLLKERAEKVSEFATLDQWQRWQQYIRENLKILTGPYPVKTPLNAKVLRTVDKGYLRIEHIVFESQPGFFVTSSLFIPSGLKRGVKAPAILYCSGHSAEGYRSPVYLHVIQNLVKKGFVVFAFDPVGQGERLEYLNPETGNSFLGGPTKEHSYPGAQAFIAGSSQAFFMIWDGIRAVDYLLTRKEVDPARIGITGRSGGGTQSAYIAALDDRIYAAAPENYITTYTRLLQSIGPQDAEQNIYQLISHGMDQPDFLLVRAPKPTLMITTTRDIFSIQGAREVSREMARIYNAYGKSEFFSMTEDDAPHESTLKNREAMYAFFRKYLSNPGYSGDEKTEPLTKDELKVTPTGQISTSFSGETVFSINQRLSDTLVRKLDNLRKDNFNFLKGVPASAKRLTGYKDPEEPFEPVFTGRFKKENCSVEKYFIYGEGDYVVPFLLFNPDKPSGRILIYLDPGGKLADSYEGGPIEQFVRNGIAVLAPDLIGTGETGPGAFEGDANFDGASHNLWYASILISRSITGIRAGDVVKLLKMLQIKYPGSEILGLAKREMTPVLLHAAVFIPDFKEIILYEPVSSYRIIVKTRMYNPMFIHNAVPGVLKEYDLPDLAAAFAPRRLIIINPVDGSGNRKINPEINSDIEIIRAGFISKHAEGQLKVIWNENDFNLIVDSLNENKF